MPLRTSTPTGRQTAQSKHCTVESAPILPRSPLSIGLRWQPRVSSRGRTLTDDFFKLIYSVLPAIPDALLLLALRAQQGRPAENAQHRHRMHEPLEVRHSLLERGRFVRQAQHLGSGHRPRGYTRAPTWLNFCTEPVDSRPHVPCGLGAKFPMSILMFSTLAVIIHKFHCSCLL